MSTPLLAYQPVRDSYTLTPGYNLIEIRLDGGKSRRRQDILGNVSIVTPTWILNSVEYNLFMGFFRQQIEEGSLQFRALLLTEQAIVMTHVCTLIGGMPKLVQQSGEAYFMSATLEVTPNPYKSFSVQFQTVGGPLYQVIDHGGFISSGDMSQFVPGKFVVVTGTRQKTPSGTIINLDGTFLIGSTASASVINLTSPHLTAPDWTVLGGLSPTSSTTGIGSCILVPD